MLNFANFYKISNEAENEEVKSEEENKPEENDNDEDTNVDNMEDDINIDFNTNDKEDDEEDEGSNGDKANTDDNMGSGNDGTDTSDNGSGSDGATDDGDVPDDNNDGNTNMDSAEGNEDGNTKGEETDKENDDNKGSESDLNSDPTNIDFNTTNGPDENKESVTDVVVDLTKAGDKTDDDNEDLPSIEQEAYKRLKLATEEAHEHLKLIEDLLANKERITKTSAVLSVEAFKHIAIKAGYRPDEMLSLSVISREALNDDPEGVLLVIREDLKEMIKCGLPL